MKVIDAFWEKRNLGVDTVEFETEKGDTLEIIRNTILANEKQYNVVKTRNGDFEIKQLMSELGYTYMESMFKLVHQMKMPAVPDAVKRIMDRITYMPMTEESEIEMMFSELDKGIFKTDRIALDPFFSPEIANLRYKNWLKDELARGNALTKGVYDGEIFAFGAYKMLDGNVMQAYLGGMFNDYLNCGLAIPATFKSIQNYLSLKPKKIVTHFSTNNHNSLMCDISAGYVIKGISDIYIKHKD